MDKEPETGPQPPESTLDEHLRTRDLARAEQWERAEVANFLDDPANRRFEDFDDRFENVILGSGDAELADARTEQLRARLADEATTIGDLIHP
ncbi:MAG TPA: hypothetical protein VMR98_06085 [Candidatus Polarisedimenticolaceae bacterium]|nr:hypothetical protein [Candidatus Polarisedimenticolaceae bacterium]